MTVRSAGNLLADLTACRSFRHLKGEQLESAVQYAFTPKTAGYYSPLHQALGYVCEDCGRPRSDVSGPKGKCQACYRNNTPKEWVFASDAFEKIAAAHGYSCDTCEEITEVPADRAIAAANRILDSLDGKVRPMLCKRCSRDFAAYCTREHGRDARAVNTPDYDKLYIGYIALQVSRAGWRVWQNQYSSRRA